MNDRDDAVLAAPFRDIVPEELKDTHEATFIEMHFEAGPAGVYYHNVNSTPEERLEAIRMRREGYPVKEIAARMGRSHNSIRAWTRFATDDLAIAPEVIAERKPYAIRQTRITWTPEPEPEPSAFTPAQFVARKRRHWKQAQRDLREYEAAE